MKRYNKFIAFAVALSIIVASSSAIFAFEKKISDNDLKNLILEKVEDTKELTYKDTMVYKFKNNIEKKKIISELKKTEFTEINEDFECKGYPFYLKGDNFNMGILSKEKNGMLSGTLYIGNKKYVFKTNRNVQKNIESICEESNNVILENNYNQIYFYDNNIDTAIEISKNNFARAENVVLIGKNSIADSISALGLAAYLKAPILVTEKNILGENLLNELDRLNVKKIYILSGNIWISETIKESLIKKGFNVKDYSGKNRYDTSARVAGEISKNNFILSSGEGFYDIASIASYSYSNSIPILLTKKEAIPKVSLKVIKDGSEVLIIGGKNLIAEPVYLQLKNKKARVNNISGKDRYSTSEEIVKKLYPNTKKMIFENDEQLLNTIISSEYSSRINAPIIIKSKKIFEQLKEKYDGIDENKIFIN